MEEARCVALVLGGGGARGLAHLGAIEALQAQGFRITSVAGTSMGALVGGLFAAGKINEAKNIAERLTRRRVLRMMDISPGLDHIATGGRFMQLLDSLIGDVRIEDLPIPFCCSASDVVSGQEVVFRSGPLSTAIRASISIPGFFKPVTLDNRILVDGSLHNTLPLDRVQRHPGDLLIAVNVSAPDDKPFDACLKQYNPTVDNPFTTRPKQNNLTADKSFGVNKQHDAAADSSFSPHLKQHTTTTDNPFSIHKQHDARASSMFSSLWHRLPLLRAFLKTELSTNYMNMALRVAQISIQNNTQMAMRLTPPDLCLNLPMSTFGLFDFDKAPEIINQGHQQMLHLLTSSHLT